MRRAVNDLRIDKLKENAELLVQEYVLNRDPLLREKIVKEYSPLVHHLANRVYLPASAILERKDLFQCGMMGLLAALDRFEAGYEASFRTFAYRRIRGEIFDAIRRQGLVGRSRWKKVQQLEKSVQKLTNLNGREPAPAEVCAEMKIDEDEYWTLLHTQHLNYMMPNQYGSQTPANYASYDLDSIKDDRQSPEEILTRDDLKKCLKASINELAERQKLVLALYYVEDLTLAQIGEVLDLSEARVSQILNSTLMELRNLLDQ